jgi:hypothetical protein
MSYLHCPQCSHAFNLAVTSQCPMCPVPAELVDPANDIVAAAEALARAMARATPAERTAAAERMGQPPMAPPSMLTPPPLFKAPPAPRLLTRLAESLVDRAMPRLVVLAGRAKQERARILALLPRRAGSFLRRLAA